MNKFISEAYKPEEQLMFNYLIIRYVLHKVLREQKFTSEMEILVYSLYKKFQENLNKVISLYRKIPNVLELDKLTANVEFEVDSILEDCNLETPLVGEVQAMNGIAKLAIDISNSFLDPSKAYIDSIPGFNWDIESFKKSFQEIQRKGMEYDEQIRSAQQNSRL